MSEQWEPVSRDDLLALLAERLLPGTGPRACLAIDGPDAAGKTTLADALAERLPGQILRAGIDGFHHPREHRMRRGPLSPEGYYRDSFDLEALESMLLQPFRSGASEVRLAAYDFRAGEAVEAAPVAVDGRAVLVVDGVFLLRTELRRWWDAAVYLHVAPEVTLARARVRDLALFDDVAEIELRYTQRYLPGQALYRAEADPISVATVVVDNTDPAAPLVLTATP